MKEVPVKPAILVDRALSAAFEHAERLHYVDHDGRPVTFVVLAVLQVVGNDFALVSREEDLGTDVVSVFEYHTDAEGNAFLMPCECEDIYETVLHLFDDLLDDAA